jgi:hypothetical protein
MPDWWSAELRVISSRPGRSKRPSTSDSPALDIGELRRAGAVVPGQMTHGDLYFEGGDSSSLLCVTYSADLRDPASAWIELRHSRTDEISGPPYRIIVALAPCCCSGRWRFVCPLRQKMVAVLYCPFGAAQFASSKAYHLRVPSDSYGSTNRPLHHLHRARARLESALPEPRRGGRGASSATLARLRAELTEADLRAWQGAASRFVRSGKP